MSTIAAMISNKWIKPPPIWPINPNNQSTTSIAIIVHSIVFSFFELKIFSSRSGLRAQ
jgi:hypothetical protein